MGPDGQKNANAMIHNMIPPLAAEGYQMKILPSPCGTNADWTGDVNQLLHDAQSLFNPSKRLPEKNHESLQSRVRTLLESNEVDMAIAVAQEQDLAAQLTFEGPTLQLARVISEMADLPMPKAMIYFADTGYFARESIVDTAIRSGVSIYAVKSDGIGPALFNVSLVDDPGSIARSTLVSLSEHTGGQFSFGHFRKSASDKILRKVQTDLSCAYVLSIDTAGLDRERILRPKVQLRSGFNGKLSAETIPDFLIPSERRQQEEAVSIALRSAKWPGVRPARVSVVPVGVENSHVNAWIQLSLDSELGALSISTAWDVGINYSGRSRVSGYGNLRVKSRSPKIVFEHKVRLPVGPYWIVAVAQEVDGRGLARSTQVGTFKKPKKNAVEFLHPVDIMQWGSGAFVSEGREPRSKGWISLPYAMANYDQPILLVVSLCRGNSVHEPLTIEKSLLLPHQEFRFSKTNWPQEQDTPCLVVKDELLPADRLPRSKQPYEVTVVVRVSNASRKVVAETSKVFWVIGPAH